MKNTLKSIIYIIAISFIAVACKKPAHEKEVAESEEEIVLSQEQIDSLHFAYIAINDSLDASWTIMIQDDDEKIADMKRLLKEVSSTKGFDKARHDSLAIVVSQLPDMRYDRISMADSDKIDEYDSASSEITKDVILFAANHPQYQNYPKLEEIINDIQEADNRVIIHRIKYDRSAKTLNSFLRENQKHILRIDSNAHTWQEASLFELSE